MEDARDCEVEAEVKCEEDAAKAVCGGPSVDKGAANDLETGYGRGCKRRKETHKESK